MSPRRPSPTTVIACLALFFAVAGGTAIALKGRNTVDSGDIKKGQVKTSDIANNAVTTRKIKNGGVRRADLAASEPYHVIAPAQFNHGGEGDCFWASVGTQSPGFGDAAFYKDNLGVVHLRGAVLSTAVPAAGDGQCDTSGGSAETREDSKIFTLPHGYAPPQLETFPVVNTTGPEFLFIGPVGGAQLGSTFIPEGSVEANFGGEEALPLGGLTFRAAGPGVGLPRRSAQAIQGPAPARGVIPLP